MKLIQIATIYEKVQFFDFGDLSFVKLSILAVRAPYIGYSSPLYWLYDWICDMLRDSLACII